MVLKGHSVVVEPIVLPPMYTNHFLLVLVLEHKGPVGLFVSVLLHQFTTYPSCNPLLYDIKDRLIIF